MAEKGINIKVNIEKAKDIEKLLKNLSNLDGAIDDTGKAFKNTSKDVDIFNKSVGNVSDSQVETIESMKQMNKIITDATAPLKHLTHGFGGLIGKIEGFIPVGVGFQFGIRGVIQDAHQANMEIAGWRAEMAELSDVTGDSSKALGRMYDVFAKSGGSLATIRGNLKSLVSQGISPSTEGFNVLAATVTNLALATGIGAESFSSFAGIMIRNWGISVGATQRMTSSILAMQEAFGSTATEIQETMKITGDVMQKMGAFFRDGAASAKALTKGIAQTVGVLNKMGVSAQEATGWVSKMLDPEQISETRIMWAKLGITYQEQIDMMTSANAKELVFDKLMKNLPQVARQIQNISDPLARINFAKTIGLPMEIAQKMARATTGDIMKLMKDYKDAAKADEAMAKKQKRMQAETARFTDIMHQFKMDALAPMMQWITKNMDKFFRVVKIISNVFKKYTGGLAKTLNVVTKAFEPALNILEGRGGDFSDFMGAMAQGFIEVASNTIDRITAFIGDKGSGFIGEIGESLLVLAGKIINGITVLVPKLATSLATTWVNIFSKHPVTGAILGIYAGSKLWSSTFGKLGNFVAAYMLERRTKVIQHREHMGLLRIIAGKGAGGVSQAFGSGAFGFGGKGSVGKFLGGKGGLIAGLAAMALPSIIEAVSGEGGMERGGIGEKATGAVEKAGTIQTAAWGVRAAGKGLTTGAFKLGAKGLTGITGKLIGGAAKFGGILGKAAGPIGIAISGLIGGFTSAAKASEYFGEKATFGMKATSFLGGALESLTFGLIDAEKTSKRLYGETDTSRKKLIELDKKIAEGKMLSAKEQEEYNDAVMQSKGAWDRFGKDLALYSIPLYGQVKMIGDAFDALGKKVGIVERDMTEYEKSIGMRLDQEMFGRKKESMMKMQAEKGELAKPTLGLMKEIGYGGFSEDEVVFKKRMEESLKLHKSGQKVLTRDSLAMVEKSIELIKWKENRKWTYEEDIKRRLLAKRLNIIKKHNEIITEKEIEDKKDELKRKLDEHKISKEKYKADLELLGKLAKSAKDHREVRSVQSMAEKIGLLEMQRAWDDGFTELSGTWNSIKIEWKMFTATLKGKEGEEERFKLGKLHATLEKLKTVNWEKATKRGGGHVAAELDTAAEIAKELGFTEIGENLTQQLRRLESGQRNYKKYMELNEKAAKKEREIQNSMHKELKYANRQRGGIGAKTIRAIKDKGKEAETIDRSKWIQAFIGTKSSIKITTGGF